MPAGVSICAFRIPAVEKGTVVAIVGADDVGHFLHQGIGVEQRADAVADGQACLQLQAALLRDLAQLLDQVAGQGGRSEQAIGGDGGNVLARDELVGERVMHGQRPVLGGKIGQLDSLLAQRIGVSFHCSEHLPPRNRR